MVSPKVLEFHFVSMMMMMASGPRAAEPHVLSSSSFSSSEENGIALSFYQGGNGITFPFCRAENGITFSISPARRCAESVMGFYGASNPFHWPADRFGNLHHLILALAR